MHTLFALLLTAAASLVIARPPDPVSNTASQDDLDELPEPNFLWPNHASFAEIRREPHRQPMASTAWLNQEIERLSRMQISYDPEIHRRLFRSPQFKRWPNPYTLRGHIQPYWNQPRPAFNLVSEDMLKREQEFDRKNRERDLIEHRSFNGDNKKQQFALTPRDQGYFDPNETVKPSVNVSSPVELVGGRRSDSGAGRAAPPPELQPEPPRHTRQNPNLKNSRTKTLIAENLDDLRTGLGHEDTMDSGRRISHMEPSDSPASFYGVALLSAVGAAAVLALVGFAFGWYTLSKRAKAAADVDYPAYGVTGPTIDTSGDRKLAHSAHMYHYQHQKQQIIAMERSGMEQRSGSVSDPESDDENEEGDYTVYECPGFATTGDMEVKNPLFNEDPTPATPATPGKCEVVKPQPKD